ncbi:hypothetical protein D3C78_1951190 [compost metagenome]
MDPEQIDEATQQRLTSAKQLLSRAIELHDKCGAKKDLEGVERLLKKHAGPAS